MSVSYFKLKAEPVFTDPGTACEHGIAVGLLFLRFAALVTHRIQCDDVRRCAHILITLEIAKRLAWRDA